MFTGIIEEQGKVVSIQKGRKSCELSIQGKVIFSDMKVGDSIAVNGVCLTVNSFEKNVFNADVMSETLNRSSLGLLKKDSHVNLERAMPACGRFGGHIVSGHIDGTGTITNFRKDGNAVWLTVHAPEEILRYIVEKGSIAIDGISLTVANVQKKFFEVSIIPHTAASTALTAKKAGDIINLENDMVGKYIEKFLTAPPAPQKPQSIITSEFLARSGF